MADTIAGAQKSSKYVVKSIASHRSYDGTRRRFPRAERRRPGRFLSAPRSIVGRNPGGQADDGPEGYAGHIDAPRIHRTLRVTPAMQAGLSDHVWSIEEIIGLLDRAEQESAA